MKKSFIVALVLAMLFIPSHSSATKWAHQFVVWNGNVYIVQEELVTNIDKEIGQVTAYSDMSQLPGNFSNIYLRGTKYYSIKDINTSKAIAVKIGKDKYKKADKDGEYLVKGTGEDTAKEEHNSGFAAPLLAFIDHILKWLF